MAPESQTDRVRDLAAALGAVVGVSSGGGLMIDGRRVDADVLLAESGVVNGSIIDVETSPPGPFDATDRAGCAAVVEVACVAGPDCAPWRPLGVGRHVIGRSSSAGICLDDQRVELHHALIEVDTERARVTQLTGQAPLRIDGVPLGGSIEIVLPAVISIGSSELWVRSVAAGREAHAASDDRVAPLVDSGTLAEAPTDPWRRVVHRAPDRSDPAVGDPIVVPVEATVRRAPPATALIGAAVAVVGAGAIAAFMGQMMFALFALFGAVASTVTWLAGAAGAWRSNRRERRLAATDRLRFLADLERQRRDAEQRSRAMLLPVEQAVATGALLLRPGSTRSDVWRRRIGEPGGAPAQFRVVVGRGSSRWVPTFDGELHGDLASVVEQATRLDGLPTAVQLDCGDVVAIAGDRPARDALIRSLVCQLAVLHGPADWRLIVVSAAPAEWEWTSWLPHSRSATRRPPIVDPTDEAALGAALASADSDRSPVTVLVVDDPALFAVRTGHLRRFIDRVEPLTLASIALDRTAPAMTRRIISVGPTGRIDRPGLGDDAPWGSDGGVSMCGLSLENADRTARALAGLVDPEESSSAESCLPVAVPLSEIAPVLSAAIGAGSTVVGRSATTAAVCRRWLDAGRDPAPRAAIGRSADGIVEVDLVTDGPHALIAGTTGAGKSELLRSLVVGLALRHSPEFLTFVLVDYKGGSTFDRCAELPHTVGVVTDLDAGLAERALVSLDAELHRRERLLRAVGAADLADYRQHADAAVLPRLVVVIDEFAALAKELPDFLAALIGVAQRGRSLGIHLILATQRPAGVVNDDIRANTNLRLALRLNDTADAHDVVGHVAPAEFSREVPGRAALRLGPGELVVFQAARCSGPARRHITGLIASPVDSRSGVVADADGAPTELDVAVRAVADAFGELSIDAPHRPWIDALPDRLTCATVDLVAAGVDHGGVGVIDDPAHQCWRVLRWHRERGSLALIGGLGSGATSTLRAVIAERCRRRSATLEHWYVIDARGESSLHELGALSHVGAVVRLHETERLHRVLVRLTDEIDRRRAAPLDDQCVSLGIDGLHPLRTALASIEQAPTLALLERVLTDGPAVGVMSCWTDDGVSSFRAAVASETWVLRCETSDVARSAGVVPVESRHPGRLRVASSGNEALVAVDAGHIAVNRSARSGGAAPAPVEILAHAVRPDEMPAGPRGRRTSGAVELDIGLAYSDLGVATLRVPDSDHIFIGGAASTGKTTALRQVVAAWRTACPAGEVILVDRRHPLPTAWASDHFGRTAPTLIAVDDVERVDDVDGQLAAIVGGGQPDITIAAAGRLEAVRSAYGHWARDVARSRCGLIMTSAGDVDGDLLGATLPRRTPVAARPGLGWVVDGAGHRLIQVVDAQPLDVSPSNQRGPVP